MVKVRIRVVAATAALALSVVSMIGAGVPTAAHSYSCSTGNSNQVVIVFVDGYMGGTKDDLCWKDGHSRDDELSVNESDVDDIGENANFHDKVSSFEVVNYGTLGLCVEFYIDAYQRVFG
jgi:hypothetical protein